MKKSFSYICPKCGHSATYTQLITVCPECLHDWLDPVYDQTRLAALWRDGSPRRESSIWRYWDALPLLDSQHIVTMGEGWTPLLRADNLGPMLGHRNIFIKDERQGPTTSFKDRQASVAISIARENNIKDMVVASTGNVAISYSAYCARAGIKLWAFLDQHVPQEKVREVTLYSTEVIKVASTYDKTKQVAAQFAKYQNIFLDKGLKGMSARESMKTLGLEVAEQLGEAMGKPWAAPDWYVQAVSGGMGPIGVWQGFKLLHDLGLIDKLPKIAVVQTQGCAPMVNSYHKGLEQAENVENPQGVINVLATGSPGAAYPFLRNLALTYGGAFIKVDDQASFRAMRVMAQLEGLSMEPAAGVACAGLIKMVQERIIGPDETVVINISGHTFPVEKQILENEIVKSHINIQNLEAHEVEDFKQDPKAHMQKGGLMSILQRLDARVKSIAIVEDEPDARVLLRRILQHRRKYIIHEAKDGVSGLTLIREQRPDLVLLDLMMPGIDGFTILDIMGADSDLKDIPVIVITAKDLTNKDYQRLYGRVETLLQKGSFMDEELYESISGVLG